MEFKFELKIARESDNHDVLSNSNELARPIYVNRSMQGLNSRAPDYSYPGIWDADPGGLDSLDTP